MAGAAEAKKIEPEAPIIVDMGKRRRKQIKQLTQQGTGKLMDEVNECIEELKVTGKISSSVLPVIVVVKQRPKGGKLIWPGF